MSFSDFQSSGSCSRSPILCPPTFIGPVLIMLKSAIENMSSASTHQFANIVLKLFELGLLDFRAKVCSVLAGPLRTFSSILPQQRQSFPELQQFPRPLRLQGVQEEYMADVHATIKLALSIENINRLRVNVSLGKRDERRGRPLWPSSQGSRPSTT